MVFFRKGKNRVAKYSTIHHIPHTGRIVRIFTTQLHSIMKDEFQPSKNLCMAAAMVLPLSAQQQGWMRLGGDAGNVFKESAGLPVDHKLHYGASVEDAVGFLKYVCAGNRELGIKLKFEFRRVVGRHDKSRRWNVQSLMKTVGRRRGIYVIFGKAKRLNRYHEALIKRMKKADCMGEELEIFSKVAKGLSRKDHACSVRNDENGLRLFDNACTKGSIDFSIVNLAGKMIDLTDCYYFDLYEKGKKAKITK